MICFYLRICGWSYIIYWLLVIGEKYLIDLSCDISSWVFNNFFYYGFLKKSRHIQVLIFSDYLSFKSYHVCYLPYYFY